MELGSSVYHYVSSTPSHHISIRLDGGLYVFATVLDNVLYIFCCTLVLYHHLSPPISSLCSIDIQNA
jgi:hypothetical protein